MTKFLTTIAIAIFLEALVTVFDASKTRLSLMLYPILLLLSGGARIVGLGIYQRLNSTVDQAVAEKLRNIDPDK